MLITLQTVMGFASMWCDVFVAQGEKEELVMTSMVDSNDRIKLMDYLGSFFPPGTIMVPETRAVSFPSTTSLVPKITEEYNMVTTGR